MATVCGDLDVKRWRGVAESSFAYRWAGEFRAAGGGQLCSLHDPGLLPETHARPGLVMGAAGWCRSRRRGEPVRSGTASSELGLGLEIDASVRFTPAASWVGCRGGLNCSRLLARGPTGCGEPS
jgi:hypothetical protein